MHTALRKTSHDGMRGLPRSTRGIIRMRHIRVKQNRIPFCISSVQVALWNDLDVRRHCVPRPELRSAGRRRSCRCRPQGISRARCNNEVAGGVTVTVSDGWSLVWRERVKTTTSAESLGFFLRGPVCVPTNTWTTTPPWGGGVDPGLCQARRVCWIVPGSYLDRDPGMFVV